MSIPRRNASPPNHPTGHGTFFVTVYTESKRFLLQSDRMATLLVEVLFHYRRRGSYKLHDFVVLPNHFHAQITTAADIGRVMRLITAGFAYRAKKEFGIGCWIWQYGFSGERVTNREQFLEFRKYIYESPVHAGLADTPEEYRYSSAHPGFKTQRAAAAKSGNS